MNLIPFEWIAGAVAAIVGFAAIWWRGYSSAKAKAAVKAKDATIKAMEARDAARTDVDGSDARKRMSTDWQRKL